MKEVNFKIVKLWHNSSFHNHEFTIERPDPDSKSVPCYAVKIENDYFILGDKGQGVWVGDDESTHRGTKD